MQIITVLLNPAIDRVIEVRGLDPGKHLQGRLKARYPAGKAVNVSRCLAVLEHHSIATGLVGRAEVDLYRHYIRHHHGDLVECQFVPVDGRTRENITLIDSKATVETHIRDVGFTVTPGDIDRFQQVLGKLMSGETIVCFCGSLPPGIDEDIFLSLVDQSVAAGAKVVVDSSGPHMKAIAKKEIWLVKPNIRELEETSNQKLESEVSIYEAARRLNRHVEFALVSAGRRGAYLVTKDESLRGYLHLSSERIVNTVGCGDCLLAGFLAGVVDRLPHGDNLRSAVAAASASALSETPAGFQHSLFARLRQEVRIVPWNPS
jgi:1-phosphofructokinase